MARFVQMLGAEGFGTYEVDWSAQVPSFRRVAKPFDATLIPGFVDLHIHGGFGIDFMTADRNDLRHWFKKLTRQGYEALLPTTITASVEEVVMAIGQLPTDDPMVPGFHLEGPFISPDFPGAQPPNAILEPPIGPSAWDEVLEHPLLKIVTLAPERPFALDLILKMRKRGVIVSMGHTAATFETARRGFEFGATHTTHTFNAMRGLHHREAGMVGYALATDGLQCELIYDRIHVGKDAAALLIKTKTPEQVIAVSDGTAAVGLPAGTKLSLWRHDVVVERDDVRLASNGALAGSKITLLDAFQNLAEDFGIETAIRLCSLNPRRALGMPSAPRRWVLLDRHLGVQTVYELGRPIEL